MERLEQSEKNSEEPKSGTFKFPAEGMREALSLRGAQPEFKQIHNIIPKLALFSNENGGGKQQQEAGAHKKNSASAKGKKDQEFVASEKPFEIPVASDGMESAEKNTANAKVPEMAPEFDLKVDFKELLNDFSIPEKFASAGSGAMLLMNGRNFTLQEKFGISPGQSHEAYVKALKTSFHWTDGMLKVGKALSVPSLALAGTNMYTDSSKFMSGEHSKLLYGTALAFDGITAAGAAAQLISKKFLAPITCVGLLGRALTGGAEHFL